MRYGSVCSGVEAATLAWMPLGWECKFVSEVEPFPCAVLQERFGATAPIHPLAPNEATSEADRKMRLSWKKQNETLKKDGVIPNEGDFTKIGTKYAGQIDLLVGGTPCQDLSVAGKRAGFDGERSSLAIDFVRLAYESQCKWFVWENVPGVFSSNNWRDFATFLSLCTGCEIAPPRDGWSSAGFVCNGRTDRFGVAWRVLDAQFTRTQSFPFAIPQRRRRVFVVGYLGDWRPAAEVLLEPSRSEWHTPARIRTRKRIAKNAQRGIGETSSELSHWGENAEQCIKGVDFYNQTYTDNVAKTLNAIKSDSDHVPCVQETSATYINNSFGGYKKSECGTTLKSSGGDTPGAENIVMFWNGEDVSTTLTGAFADDRMPDKGKLPCVIEEQLSVTLGCNNDQTLFVVHGAETPISNSEHANPCTCNHNGLENVVCWAAGGFGQKVESDIAAIISTDHDDRVTGNNAALIQEISSVAIAENIIGRKVENGGNGIGAQEELAYTQNASGVMGVCTKPHSTVRRLLPIECERLMGFPDNHTRIAWKGKLAEECPDSPRYKACGNSMCVNVMEYIGRQIDKVERKKKQK